MKKKGLLTTVVVGSALLFSGCDDEVKRDGESVFRNNLVDICVEHGCDPAIIEDKVNEKIRIQRERYVQMREARGFRKNSLLRVSGNRTLIEDRNRIREGLLQNFRDEHSTNDNDLE